MLIKHFFLPKIAHSSYILAGKKTCAVIDPRRDVDIYIDEARKLGVTITHILETHLHADFISGHMDLAEKTGARIYAPRSAKCKFDHVPLSEGDYVELEDMRLDVLEVPGHTPEHLAYVVTDQSRGDNPVGVFVGDALFVGDVGRPDLFPDMANELAGKLYHSLHDKLLKLPDYCEVYPAHGAGSLCGRSMGAKWRSTIGYERMYNSALKITDKTAFIKSLTTDMPPAPDHFSRCSDINRDGPELIRNLPIVEELVPADFLDKLHDPDTDLLDVRSYAAFAGLHIPGAWHLDINGNFPTFAGWVLPPEKNILVVADSFQEATEAVDWARRVGIDHITGYLKGGMVAWVTDGQKIDHVNLISAQTLHERITGSADMILVDTRAPAEFNDSHISGAINIPSPDLRSRYKELKPEKPVYLICSTGNRSSLAASILKRNGFSDIYNVAGGMTGYSAAGHARLCKVCVNPHGPRYSSDFPSRENNEV
ncbi:MAG: rhodanese-like domain-containing protein [Dehalococcoidales bacterium]|nr:rhodanese-like domain-containing protein [Dehalococcoidales bacterium]